MGTATPASALSEEDLDALLRDPHGTVEHRVLRAARRRLVVRGLAVSIDEIALEAGIGRRTVFRHFPSRDELVARALDQAIDGFHAQASVALSSDLPLERWLVEVLTELHGSQRRAGRGLWELMAADEADLPAPLARVDRRRRALREELTVAIATTAWKRAGGRRKVPRSVELAFALAISTFSVQSLEVDYRAGATESAQAIAAMLGALLDRSVNP